MQEVKDWLLNKGFSQIKNSFERSDVYFNITVEVRTSECVIFVYENENNKVVGIHCTKNYIKTIKKAIKQWKKLNNYYEKIDIAFSELETLK